MEVLPPRVQHRQETDGRAQALGIGRDGEQRFRCSTKQDAINLAGILECEPTDLFRQRKYDVEIRDRQQFSFPFGQPLGARQGLAFWAMPVAAGVIRDDAVPARIALLHVFHMAAESGRTAVADRFESFSLSRTEYLSPLSEELFFVRAEDIGHFEPMLSHRCGGTVLAARTRSSEPSISSGLFVERTALSERCR
jgi:hypothetical protein